MKVVHDLDRKTTEEEIEILIDNLRSSSGLTRVLIIGEKVCDGELEIYSDSTSSFNKDLLWTIEQFKRELLSGDL